MFYKLEYSPYQRQFKQPLKTHHGIWETRFGIILYLQTETGETWLGEISPLSWFGSETNEAVWDFCQQLPPEVSETIVDQIPDSLPACQWGFSSAFALQITSEFLQAVEANSQSKNWQYSYLLPTVGTASEIAVLLEKSPDLLKDYQTFKWKIGVHDMQSEMVTLQKIIELLNNQASLNNIPTEKIKIRLDANTGLTFDSAKQWLKLADNLGNIEFLEQPLPVDQYAEMLALTQEYATPIALDESVSNFAQLTKLATADRQKWPGIFVIKSSIMGKRSPLENLIKSTGIDVVFSSVFETAIGQYSNLKLAEDLADYLPEKRALGFAVNQWFDQSFLY